MIRLLLADDHPIIHSGLEALLRGTQFEIVAYVRTGDEVLPAIAASDPDIVLLDERLPGRLGLDVFRDLRAKGDDRPVVMLTGSMSDRRAAEAMDAGIQGLVLKHAAPDHLLDCLEEVRRGGRWIDRTMLQRALDIATGRELRGGRFDKLTVRERSVIRLVADNKRTSEIAERLGIAASTVKVHLHNVYEKLGLASRAELLALIRETGISG